MHDELAVEKLAILGARPSVITRVRTYLPLVRRDRRSARLARKYTTLTVLDDALLVLGDCVVEALLAGGGGPATRRAVDLVWRILHRKGTGAMNWNSPDTMYALQVRDLRRWNNAASRTPNELFALLRAAYLAAGADFDRVRPSLARPVSA